MSTDVLLTVDTGDDYPHVVAPVTFPGYLYPVFTSKFWYNGGGLNAMDGMHSKECWYKSFGLLAVFDNSSKNGFCTAANLAHQEAVFLLGGNDVYVTELVTLIRLLDALLFRHPKTIIKVN